MTLHVYLDLAVNDPDNGNRADRLNMVSLPDTLLELTATGMRSPVFRTPGQKKLKIGRRMFAYSYSQNWVGNWCWNRYFFHPDVAVDVLAYLHDRGDFSPEMGSEELWEIWEGEQILDCQRKQIADLLLSARKSELRRAA